MAEDNENEFEEEDEELETTSTIDDVATEMREDINRATDELWGTEE